MSLDLGLSLLVFWLGQLWDRLRELALFSLAERAGELLEPLPVLKRDLYESNFLRGQTVVGQGGMLLKEKRRD